MRPSECAQPGISIAQSGCSLYRSLFTLSISGSTHIPNDIPSAFILSHIPLSPFGSFFLFTYQSPSELLSSSLFPNQPSSMTKSSIPTSCPAFASSYSFLSLISKYAASQLLSSTGRSLYCHCPRTICFLTKSCIFLLMALKPLSE